MYFKIPTIILLSFSMLFFSACSDIKETVEYRAIASDYNYLKQQITGKSQQKTIAKKQPVIVIKKVFLPKKTSPKRVPKAPHNNCRYILRDLSKPNAKAIWCIPRMVM